MYFLREFMDCFAWTTEMPRLDLEIAVHKLNISKDAKQVKQDQRRTKSEIKILKKKYKSFRMFNLSGKNNTLTG